jgi:Iap family predicted aminopeptidase
MRAIRVLAALAFAVCHLTMIPSEAPAVQESPKFSTVEQLAEEFKTVPCQNSDRLKSVTALFARMGAAEVETSVQTFGKVRNFVVTKPGTTDDIIVVGAHYDKVEDGCGALDNWTGIVTIAHVYKALKSIPLKKTIMFVAFGQEESGLVGSHAMANAIKQDQRIHYCAMVNIDSLGLAAPQVMSNVSTPKLESLTGQLAKEMKVPFGSAPINNASADSLSFIIKDIPALTIHGLTNDWASILHSMSDQAKAVKPVTVYLGYRLSLALIAKLDDLPCDAFKISMKRK